MKYCWFKIHFERVCAAVCPLVIQAKEAGHGKVIYLVVAQEFFTGAWKHWNNEQFKLARHPVQINHNNAIHKTNCNTTNKTYLEMSNQDYYYFLQKAVVLIISDFLPHACPSCRRHVFTAVFKRHIKQHK